MKLTNEMKKEYSLSERECRAYELLETAHEKAQFLECDPAERREAAFIICSDIELPWKK